MRKLLSGFILFTFFLMSIAAFSQAKDYPIKKINGTEYYLYKVQASEGLFAVGRKFEVSPEEIVKANPEVKNGLKVGQELLIPVKKKNISQTNGRNTTKLTFVGHKVEKKQTLFGISSKYNVSQEDLRKYNPELENGLREGMTLRIPVFAQDSAKRETPKPVAEKAEAKSTQSQAVAKSVSAKKEDARNVLIHVVLPDETLYSISRRYKVDVSDIIALNPLSADKLAIGTELKIPMNQGGTIAQNKDTLVKSAKQGYNVNNMFDSNILTKRYEGQKTIRLAFLLPFMLEQDKKDPSVDRFVDFYAGALLAIKDAKEKGISFEIHSFDTENSEEKLLEVLDNSELKTMDLIIGPAFTNQVSLMSDYAKSNRVNTLIPFTSKVADIEDNPYLFQFNPGVDSELNFASELFTGRYKNMNLIFAEIPGISSSDEGKVWADRLKKVLKKSNRSFVTLPLTTSDVADFGSVMQFYAKNLVVFNTDKFAYISPFIAPLKDASQDYNVVLFEQYSWRRQQDKLPKGLCFSAFRPTLDPTRMAGYNKEFNYYFGKSSGNETPRYDLLGYDLTSYFSALISKYGSKFPERITTFTYPEGLQSNPRFEHLDNGAGFVNTHIYLIED